MDTDQQKRDTGTSGSGSTGMKSDIVNTDAGEGDELDNVVRQDDQKQRKTG